MFLAGPEGEHHKAFGEYKEGQKEIEGVGEDADKDKVASDKDECPEEESACDDKFVVCRVGRLQQSLLA